MRRTARGLSKELRQRVDTALAIGAGALALTAFLAVGREGLETSLFIWSAVQSTGQGVQPVVGATLGLLTAVVLGYLFYKGAVRINLSGSSRGRARPSSSSPPACSPTACTTSRRPASCRG